MIDSLIKLRDAIYENNNEKINIYLPLTLENIIENYDESNAIFFIKLLSMIRNKSIVKHSINVMDLIIFPVKIGFKIDEE